MSAPLAPSSCVPAGWMIAAVGSDLVAVGPDAEVTIGLESAPVDPELLINALADGAGSGAVATAVGISTEDAGELITALRDIGALGEPVEAVVGIAGRSLWSALTDGPIESQEIVWTAEEALVLPADLSAQDRDQALRSWISGMQPFARMRAYALALRGGGRVTGDRPDAELLSMRLREIDLDPHVVTALELGGDRRHWTAAPAELTTIGAQRAHRLGTVVQIGRPEPLGEEVDEIFLAVAEIADANLDAPANSLDRRVQGVGSRDHCTLVARAEGAERYATADLTNAGFHRAASDELENVVSPSQLFALNARQLADRGVRDEDGDERSWCAAMAEDGSTWWAPAEAVYISPIPGNGPSSLQSAATSSGVAAHTSRSLAQQSALCELIERDAFVWTWVQQLTRETISERSIPADVQSWSRTLAAAGWRAHWVNLTLETLPVVLCCLAHPERGLVCGVACKPEPVEALRRSTLEAMVIALRFRPEAHLRVEREAVDAPVDHLMLHMDPSLEPEQRFLYASDEAIALDELSPAPGSASEMLVHTGITPLFVDLTSPRTTPFHVVRAFAPGLVPLTFGFDNEPLGLAALGRPRPRFDGAPVGRSLDLSHLRMAVPHPFA